METPKELKVKKSVDKVISKRKAIEENDVIDLEEDLLKLKKEIQREELKPGNSSMDEQSISSLKVYKSKGLLKSIHAPRKKVNLTFDKLAGIQKNLKKKCKNNRNKKTFIKNLNGKLYNTMDDNITREIKSHYKNLNQITESRHPDMEESNQEKQLLKWRKERIKNYGKGKFKKSNPRQGVKTQKSTPKTLKRKSTFSEIKKKWKNKKKEIAASVDMNSFPSKKKEPEILILVSGNYSQKSKNKPKTEAKLKEDTKEILESAKTDNNHVKIKKKNKKSRFYNNMKKDYIQKSLPNNSIENSDFNSNKMIKPNMTPNKAPKTTFYKLEANQLSADSSFEWLMDDKGLPISDMDPSLINFYDKNDPINAVSNSIRKMDRSENWNRASLNPSVNDRRVGDIRRSLQKKFHVRKDISTEVYENHPVSRSIAESKHSADLLIENKLISEVFEKKKS